MNGPTQVLPYKGQRTWSLVVGTRGQHSIKDSLHHQGHHRHPHHALHTSDALPSATCHQPLPNIPSFPFSLSMLWGSPGIQKQSLLQFLQHRISLLWKRRSGRCRLTSVTTYTHSSELEFEVTVAECAFTSKTAW